MNVLVTGASVGFGRAIALRFASLENITLFILARREELLLSLKEEILLINKNAKVHIIACDIRDFKALESRLKDEQIDVLVNNAGLAKGLSSAEECDLSNWELMLEVNIKAVLFLTRLLLPSMVANKKGHIINISSTASSYAYFGANVYGASKAFINQFSANLRADLYDKNIRVTNIMPGLSGGSEFSLVRFDFDAKKANEVYENTKPLNPSDIAEVVFFTACLSSHVNINSIEMMPTIQASAGLKVHKT